jgi:DNA-binding GntR family transcriptional regulator
MSELIGHIAHPAPVLSRSNDQHAQLVGLLDRRDGFAAARLVREHLKGTEQVLAGLMP